MSNVCSAYCQERLWKSQETGLCSGYLVDFPIFQSKLENVATQHWKMLLPSVHRCQDNPILFWELSVQWPQAPNLISLGLVFSLLPFLFFPPTTGAKGRGAYSWYHGCQVLRKIYGKVIKTYKISHPQGFKRQEGCHSFEMMRFETDDLSGTFLNIKSKREKFIQ